jgi:hypothetical protein
MPVFTGQPPGLLVEFVVGIPLWLILILLALDGMAVAAPKARLTETFFEIGLLRYEVAERFAVTGQWPDGEALGSRIGRGNPPQTGLSRIDAQDGSFHLILDPELAVGKPRADSDEPYVLSMIRQAKGDGDSHFVIFACGYASPLPGMTRAADNRTNLPRAFLPPICKL